MREFAQFRLDTVNLCLWRHLDAGNDERVALTPKGFAVLRYLVERAGRLVTRGELLAAVWPDTIVEPGVLDNQILNIRSALGDHPKNPAFIETMPRQGYRFIAPVSEGVVGASLRGDALSGRLVGRETTLDELRDSLEKALQGQRQIVFITGEPGIGKTALADEFQRRAMADAPGIRMARGQCVEGYGGKEPYYPMLEALSQLCRGSGGDSVVRILETLAPTWLVQFPALIRREHREMLQREIQGATRERMLREIGDALEAMASASPLLVVFEDLRWMDPATTDLISALARRRGPAKLMMLGTYRPADVASGNQPLKELSEDLAVHRLCREIALRPLTETEITEYLTREASGTKPPEELAALLYRHSEGNPLFMVAALEHLGERGLISREQGGWQLKVSLDKIDLGVPESLRKMIEAQIERLSMEEQQVLEAASLNSVDRTGFLVAARAAVIDMEPEAFEDVCEGLCPRHSIVRPAGSEKFPDGTVSACYEFVHELYREVCYLRIAPGRRVKLHRRLGEWIESHWESVNEAAAWLAEHFEKGRDWLRAIKYLQLAADTAGRRCALREAANILDHALELVGKLPKAERTVSEIEILEKRATVYAMLADGMRAIETYEALAARAVHAGMSEVEVRALIEMAWPLSWISSQRSLEIVERALRLNAWQEDPLPRARNRACCFAVRLWQGWNPPDVEEFHNAFAEILNADDRRVLAPFWANRGYISWISSEYREAHRSLIDSRVIQFETVEENPYLSFAYLVGQRVVMPMNLIFLGAWGEALREIHEAITLLDKNADYVWGQTVRLCRAFVHLHAMDFAGARAICHSALPLVRDPEPRPAPDHPASYSTQFRMCLFLTGLAETGLGNHESAREHLIAGRADMDRVEVIWDWWWRMLVEFAFTELWLAKGDLPQARQQAERFLAAAMATAEHTYQGLAWEVNARIAMAAGEWSRAEECIAKALSTIEGYEVPLAAWRVHGTAAELYARKGSGDFGESTSAEHHREVSRATILKLANSLGPEGPLRRIFLSAPIIRKHLGDGKNSRVAR